VSASIHFSLQMHGALLIGPMLARAKMYQVGPVCEISGLFSRTVWDEHRAMETPCRVRKGGRATVAELMAGLPLLFLLDTAASAPATPEKDFIREGSAGFVVSHIEYALAKEIAGRDVCPMGLTPAPKRGPASRGVPSGTTAQRAQALPADVSACADPRAAGPDPDFRIASAPGLKGFGFDLDNRASRAADVTSGICAHDDLVGMTGERGIDNQLYRVLGCVSGYQPNALANQFALEMLTGSWGILISISGIDDYRNDGDVDVTFVANADPIVVSPNREPLAYATYAMHQDHRYRAKTKGRIVDGVLTTDPVDLRFQTVTNAMYSDRPLLDGVAKVTLREDGTLEGYLAGYTPVEALYDFEFAFRQGKNANGGPADPRRIANSARGRANNLHYTCNGVYHALSQMADARPDAQTGGCTAISTQYRITAIAAFVVDVASRSVNEIPAR
jgi:hypothetical protein